MSWSDEGYPGGPMVKVPGFPRPLYPPDATGYRPSVNGPDVEAYKRTVSRAGRWPWQTFDQAYHDNFAHGKSSAVLESGVAGVQRQQHLDATGYIGTKTFDTLRSIRIPNGLPHAGEPAMDPISVDLIEEAWDIFGGTESAPDPAGSIRSAALKLAIGELGYRESPPGSNANKYGAWYGMNYVPWCAIFCTWCYETAGPSDSFVRGSRWAYCPYIVADARARRFGLSTTDDPIPGDLVVYDWRADTIYDHVGLFEKWLGGTGLFSAIEGNTSTASDSNGGSVMRRSRSRNGQRTVFVRVAE